MEADLKTANLVPTTLVKGPSPIETAKQAMKGSLLLKVFFVTSVLVLLGIAIGFIVFSTATSSVTEEANKIREKSKSLKDNISKLNKQIEEKSRTISDLTSKSSQKDKDIDARKKEIANLQEEKSKLESALRDAQDAMKRNNDEISRLQTTLNQKNSEITRQQIEISDLDTTKKNREHTIEEVKKKTHNYQLAAGGSMAINLAAGIELIFAYSAISKYKTEINTLHIHKKALEQQKTQHQGEIVTKDAEIKKLKDAIQQKQNEITGYNSQISTLQQQRDELKVNLVSVKGDYDALKKKFDDLTTQYNQLQADYNKMNADYKQMLIDIPKVKQDTEYLQGNYTELQGKYKKVSDDYDALNKNYVQLTDTHNTLVAAYKDLQDKYAKLKTSFDDLTVKYDLLNSQFSTLKKDDEKLKTDYATLSTTFNDLNTKYTDLNKNYNDLVKNNDDLTKEHTLWQDKMAKLKVNSIEVLWKLDEAAVDKVLLHALKTISNIQITEKLLFNATEKGFLNTAIELKMANLGQLLVLIGTVDHSYFGVFLHEIFQVDEGEYLDQKAYSFSRNHSEICHVKQDLPAYRIVPGKMLVLGKDDIVIENQADPLYKNAWTLGHLTPNTAYEITPPHDPNTFYHDGADLNITSILVYSFTV